MKSLAPIELPGNPTTDPQAARKQYVDARTSDFVRASDFGWSTSATAAANDTAIAAAITAARAGNRRLYLGAGTYNISAPIDIRAIVGDGTCIELFGAGRANTIVMQQTATADVLRAGGYSCYIHDLTLRHTEAAFTATPTTLGAGLAMFKLAYGTVERVQLTANGRGIHLPDADVFEPGSSSGVGNYFHSISFTDCFILRYGVAGIQAANNGDVSTGSSFRGVWIQNQATDGTPIAPSVRALDLGQCDEMSFIQLNIEDCVNNMPVLLNSCGAIVFQSCHFERCNLNGGDPQYIRVAGGSQLIIDGMTFAFSDVAVAGTTGTSHYFTAVTGGRIDARGVMIKNMSNTAARPVTFVELDDSTEGSAMDVTLPLGGSVPSPLTNTSTNNAGYLRVGDRLSQVSLPNVPSRTIGGSGAGGFNVDAGVINANNVQITATGDATLNVPTNGTNNQILQYTVLASAAQRTVTIASGISRLTGVNASYVVPSGKVLRVAMRYTTLGTARWIAESAAVEL